MRISRRKWVTLSGGGFIPSAFAGLKGWWDKSDIATLFQDAGKTTPVTADGDVLGAVADKSINGNDELQATTSRKPLYKTNIQNGLSVARFDGTDDEITASLGAFANPMSIFVVVYFDLLNQPAGNFDYVLNIGDGTVAPGANSINAIARWNGGDGDADKYYTFNGAAVFKGPVLTGQTWMIISALHNSSAPFHNMWLNGVSQTVEDYGTTISTAGEVQLGRFGNANPLKGDVGELVIYDSFLSAGSRIVVQNYLSNKWGIAIA